MGMSMQAFAQLPPMYEQFQLNQLTFNPAYAGSTGVLDANFFLHRHAVNFGNGAPRTEAITLHAPLANDKVGLGAKVYRDKVGVTTTNFVGVDYAYRIHVSDNMTLAIGLEAAAGELRAGGADDDVGVEPGVGEGAPDHGGGGALAVSAGDGDAGGAEHDPAEGFGVEEGGDAPVGGGEHLGVIVLDSGGGDD